MDDMTQSSAVRSSRARTNSDTPHIFVEEDPYFRRVLIATATHRWKVTLPVDGYDYDLMQYQIASGDAASTTVLELKLDGGTYRRAVADIRSDAAPETVCRALDLLLQPLVPLMEITGSNTPVRLTYGLDPSDKTLRTGLVAVS
ncbi:hypothetical protein [Nocardioides sp. GCM10030258]|uniref:hypothetical protein n=1 Tax=unclassified Nocardioides TaxID=2615069 RepID=UPI0036107783